MAELHYETHTHDVLVIGAGGAGLRAAIEASAMGLSVALVCKSLLGKAHTVMAEGGLAAAMANVDAHDGWQTHFKDTMRGNKFLGNWKMAQLHAQEAPERVHELERWGAVFDRTADGKVNQRAFGGHSCRRLVHVGDRTGLELIRTLQDKGVHSGIDVFMECAVTDLLTDEGRVAGAFGYWRESGRFAIFRAKAVILATGGIGQAFKITSNSWEYTADGHGMAFRAGAEMIDMEFIQFHPTGMVWPPGVRGILVTEAVRGEGGRLTNSLGERFMENYDPKRMELSTRDIVAKAINSEVKAGRGSPHGGVFLDISHRDADYIKKKLPSMYHQFKELADVDITAGPMEVGPTTHYTMGGLRVDPETQETTVPGLFACGEVSGGLHGANRLGGNSLSDLIVFGRRAGVGAVAFAKANATLPSVNEAQVKTFAQQMMAPFEREGGESPYQIHSDLREMMQSKCGIVRDPVEVQQAIDAFPAYWDRVRRCTISGSRQYNPGWHLAFDLQNMLIASEAVARCALQRTESRGGHTRVDYANYDPYWAKHNSTIRRGPQGEVQVGVSPLPIMPDELKQLFDENEVPST
ncbi:MAG: FAD-dependent oxidoreductase [Candidatus Melainabacteria bacterium]|nr:FAD-dependent oxidoreductase [Candidatus Melainabacteria bacterium]